MNPTSSAPAAPRANASASSPPVPAATASASSPPASTASVGGPPSSVDSGAALAVVRRTGERIPFDEERIRVAITKAFVAVEGDDSAGSARVRSAVRTLTADVVRVLSARRIGGLPLRIEEIQDQVELALMRAGHHAVARAYVLYRESRARSREHEVAPRRGAALHVVGADGARRPVDEGELLRRMTEACRDVPDTDADLLTREVVEHLYDGVTEGEVASAGVMAARAQMEREPGYSRVAARLLLVSIRAEAVRHLIGVGPGGDRAAETLPGIAPADLMEPVPLTGSRVAELYRACFEAYVRRGVEFGHLAPELLGFDLVQLASAIEPDRDLAFEHLGLQTLYDRYLLHHGDIRYELPQAFFMRVAMGLALNEEDREERAIEFYDLLSTFRFMSSTPTLFNSGTRRPQLSSCFLTTIPDDLAGIYSGIRDNALLSKYAGGLGNDWTRVRGLGAHIRGTNGRSQGVIPFLKVANDTAVAVNQGGKRKGAVCAYLEPWHIDVEEFLDLRRNTGDDRRRTHDMHTALWVPDLFMERVAERGRWTLLSPDEAPELHGLTGTAFARRYTVYEERAAAGAVEVSRVVDAEELWRRILSRLYETGHPWITFKDACNLRSPQQHVGTVHSSNLCTEITLNTSDDEVAVCNLGSINLPAHLGPSGLDRERLTGTVRTAMRMLDNVIDVNHYPVPQARRSNLRHRPVGLGIMGFQDALFRLRIPYQSEEAVRFADESTELVSYLAIEASSDLADERGSYPSFRGSLWSEGILPIDSIERLARERGDFLDQNTDRTLDWDGLREKVRRQGMRNSNTMAIAPTATISNICGVGQSVEPIFANLYVKSNLSGEFTVINRALVEDLKARGLWDEVMIGDLKFFDGSLGPIDRVPEDLRTLYATAFEIDTRWLIEAASRRQKWIDQAQSLNLYADAPDGPLLDRIYKLAWVRGLKTTYYLRSRSATQVEKSTLAETDGRLNAVRVASGTAACSLDDPGCEACQ